MTGLFGRLAARALGAAPVLTPRLPTRFEGGGGWTADAGGLEPAGAEAPPGMPKPAATGGPAHAPCGRGGAATADRGEAATQRPPAAGKVPEAAAPPRDEPSMAAAVGVDAGSSASHPSDLVALPGAAARGAEPAAPFHPALALAGGPSLRAAHVATTHAPAAPPSGSAAPPPGIVPAPGHASTTAPERRPSAAAATDPLPAAPPAPGPPPAARAEVAGPPPGEASAAAPPVEVTIGRVEIRFAAAAPAQQRPVPPPGPPPLDALLAQERRRR